MIDSAILRQIMEEGRLRPLSTFGLIIILLAFPFAWHGSASAESLQTLSQTLSQRVDLLDHRQMDLANTVRRGYLEQKLQTVEGDLFQIKERIADRSKTGRYIDPLNYEQRDKLEIEDGRLLRRLALLPPPDPSFPR